MDLLQSPVSKATPPVPPNGPRTRPFDVCTVSWSTPLQKERTLSGKNGRVLCSIKPTSPGSKSSSPCNSDNPVAGEQSQPMEVAALHILSYFYLIRPVFSSFFSYQPSVMPSRFSTVENLNRVNAASRSDVDLREGKPFPKFQTN